MPTAETPQPDPMSQTLPTPAKPDPVAQFETECLYGLRSAEELLPKILASKAAPTLETTVVPYNNLMLSLEQSSATASVIRNAHPEEKLRKAAEDCEQKAAAFANELMLNRDLYEAFVGLDGSKFDANTKRMVEKIVRDFKRAGVDKDEATRKRLKEIDDELVKLGQTFSKNIVDDVREIKVKDASGLKGLPQDFIDNHKPGADGQITITTQYPDSIPFMTYADSTEYRKALYIASRSRGDKTNEPVLRKILELRQERAKILGYANWAAYATEDKMIKSADAAQKFISRISKSAHARSRKDYAELLKYKKKLLDPKATQVDDYEKAWLENKVKAEEYKFDSQAVRPYFPFAQVQKGLLDITAEIYDISYVPVSDAHLWHPSVQAFDVMRASEKLGRIYLDMHPREGKYQHAAQFTLRSGVKGVQLPEGVLMCNFPEPGKDNPGLMEHDEVVTMFHEFGHLMHHILGGGQPWIMQSGVATEWDFVEAPSQMFEEWAWNHETLKRFAKHYQTGAEIPVDMVAQMRKADKFGIGTQTVQQMFYASISLGFHTADPAKLNMKDQVKTLQEKLTPFHYVEGTSFHTNFGHLEGYSALYYTYMWSLVIAKDLLTPFQKHGLMNHEWTKKYRDAILAPGGTQDAAVLVKNFLGRDYNFKAFEDYLAGK